MSWKTILKNYKPMGHAVQGQRNMGRQMKDPTPHNRQLDFDVSRLEFDMKNPTKMGDTYELPTLWDNNPKTLKNPDGSPKTVSQYIQENKSPINDIAVFNLKREGKNPDTMTIQEYEQYAKEKRGK